MGKVNDFFFGKKAAVAPKPTEPSIEKESAYSERAFSTHIAQSKAERAKFIEQNAFPVKPQLMAGHGMDSGAIDLFQNTKSSFALSRQAASDELLSWYVSQGFIGYQGCSLIAQNWLVNKACTVPARDAIKRGYEISVNDGKEIDEEVIAYIKKRDKKMKLNRTLVEFERHRRIFGIRIAMFIVESSDKDYYIKPFNIDGIKPGSYKGISQVDPYWITPELDADAVNNPASFNFYEPTYWRVSGQRVHRSHLIITRYAEVTDVLKPTYIYGGLPLTQLIYERVYAAERTANEAPLLAMTKRLAVLSMDLEAVAANPDKFQEVMSAWVSFRDNHGINLMNEDESVQQLETSLADLDNVIMTQYQIVAAIAEMPATKLLGTSPKGFNATGEFETDTYYDSLECIQEDVFDPLLERHYELLIRSEVMPEFGTEQFDLTVTWNPLNSPTDKELAEIREIDSRTDTALFNVGAIDGSEVRDRLITNENSGYNGLEAYTDADIPTPSTNNENENGSPFAIQQGTQEILQSPVLSEKEEEK